MEADDIADTPNTGKVPLSATLDAGLMEEETVERACCVCKEGEAMLSTELGSW